jgi:hypothetical protein
MIEVDLLERLAQPEGARLVEAVAQALDDHPLTPADITRWRKHSDPPLVSAAIEVAAARASLRGRIAAADAFWCDRAGAAQASDDLSAQWKAQRAAVAASALRGTGIGTGIGAGSHRPVLVDYCCGTGADLAHFAIALDGRVEGVDLRAERAWMAGRNSGAMVRVADVRTWRSDAPLAHIDPSRREESTGSRRHVWDALEPGPDVLADLLARHVGVMVKLGPGTDVPHDARPKGSELVHLSRGGTLTQAVLCTGALARTQPAQAHSTSPARAVLLHEGAHPDEIAGSPTWASGRGEGGWPCAPAWGRIVAEPDPSLERSGLLGVAARSLALAEVHPGLGLCTDADGCDLAAVDRSPWWRTWDVVEVVPGRLDAVRERLRSHGAGIVDVKVRGKAAPADEWAIALRSEPGGPMTTFVHRIGDRGVEALIARRRTR